MHPELLQKLSLPTDKCTRTRKQYVHDIDFICDSTNHGRQKLHACRDSVSPHDFVHLHSHFCHAPHDAWLKHKDLHLHGKSHPLMQATQTTSSQSLSSSFPWLSSPSPSRGLLCDDPFQTLRRSTAGWRIPESPLFNSNLSPFHCSTVFEPKKIEFGKNLWSTHKIR